ncbi:hypothetical protein ZONE111904_18785 [Zobellia nedashkovskayae]
MKTLKKSKALVTEWSISNTLHYSGSGNRNGLTSLINQNS